MSQYLDYQIVNSDIGAERDHLRIGDHYVRLLTMREAISETRPLVLDRLLKIEATSTRSPSGRPLRRMLQGKRSSNAAATPMCRRLGLSRR